MPAAFRRPANTGPIPSMASSGASWWTAAWLRNAGGWGSRDTATEMNLSRIAHARATMPPMKPITLASLFMWQGYPTGPGSTMPA